MKNILMTTAVFFTVNCNAQDSLESRIDISAYAEAYYSYDFNKPTDNNRPAFFYSHNRHNEFNLNLGFVKAAYNTERVRANLSIAAGTYMNANYTSEPGVIRNLFEANIGYKISRKKNIWIDAGIMPSHIGFESAISKDCWALTRSILAENSPYFEAGAKISYTTDDGKWLLSAMALNGWQRITRVNGNSLMSWGTQVQYKPSAKCLFNYSNFIGTDKPDTARQLRIFHNLYGIFNISDKTGITVGFDIGTEQKPNHAKGLNTWYSPVLMVKQMLNKQWSMTARAEYFHDPYGVVIPTNTVNGFKTMGYSMNIDYMPLPNMALRLEGRWLHSGDNVFLKGNETRSSDAFITSSVAVSF